LLRLPIAVMALGFTFLLQNRALELPFYPSMMLAVSGVIGLVFGDTFLFKAMILIGSRLSMLLLSTAPAITAILGFLFLRETLSIPSILGILITFGGVSWVLLEKQVSTGVDWRHLPIKGIIFGLLAAIGQASGLIFAKKGLVEGIDPLSGTLIRMLSATLFIWVFAFFNHQKLREIRDIKNKRAFILVALGVLFGPYLGVWFSLIAINNTNTAIAATIMSIVPVTMLPLVVWIEKESISFRAVFGAIITVLGVALIFFTRSY